jgi:DNA-binding transcriptional ArsR family regulator
MTFLTWLVCCCIICSVLHIYSIAYIGHFMKNSNPYQQAAKLFHILSHQARLHILDELRKDEACVCHLQAVLKRPQAYVSQQLRVLREAGLVTDQREGTLVYYRLADRQIGRLLEEALGSPGERVCIAECPCPHCEEQADL